MVLLGEGHICRAFSNTKLVALCAVLLLLEKGHFGLDVPIERSIPQTGHRQVLRTDTKDITDTKPVERSITIRHLLSHSAGLTNGFFDPGALPIKLMR